MDALLMERKPSISLTDYKRAIYRRYQHAPHLEALDWHLSQVTRYVETGGREGIWFLIVEMPPRHGKTLTVSRLYPSWHLGRNPDQRVMLVSYGDSLATKNSRAVRNLIASDAYRKLFPNARLSRDSKAVDAFNLDNEAEGGMDALGVLGAATGKGAHVLVCDDLVKNRQEAESPLIRDRTWDAFNDDLLSRLEPGGAVILNGTRWQVDDPTGRALATILPEYPLGRVVRLRLPAIAETDDVLGREEGTALWAERYSIERLREIERTMGVYSFSALYQQNPIPPEGRLFDTSQIQILDSEPECERIVRFYDLAVTRKTTSDYTVGLKLGRMTDGRFCVLHVWRAQKELPDVQEGIVQNARMDGSDCLIRLEAEKAGIVQLQFLLRDRRMDAYTISAEPPVGDKFTRAGPVAARTNGGRMCMVRGAWNRAFVDELDLFNAGAAHDDQVDALSGAYEMLAEAGALILFET